MKTFSVKASFRRAWELWKQNKMVLTLATLTVCALGLVPNPVEGDLAGAIFEVLIFAATTFLGMGYLKIALLIEKGEKVEFGEIFDQGRYFWRYFFATILYSLLLGVGFILLVIPGIYFALKYTFVLNLIVDKDMKIGEAFTQSGLMTEGVKWKLLGFWGMAVLVVILGAIALGVGLLVAGPVILLASVVVYREVEKESPSPVLA